MSANWQNVRPQHFERQPTSLLVYLCLLIDGKYGHNMPCFSRACTWLDIRKMFSLYIFHCPCCMSDFSDYIALWYHIQFLCPVVLIQCRWWNDKTMLFQFWCIQGHWANTSPVDSIADNFILKAELTHGRSSAFWIKISTESRPLSVC
jgi:hypothetical protein